MFLQRRIANIIEQGEKPLPVTVTRVLNHLYWTRLDHINVQIVQKGPLHWGNLFNMPDLHMPMNLISALLVG